VRTCSDGTLSGAEAYATPTGNEYFNHASCSLEQINPVGVGGRWKLEWDDEFSSATSTNNWTYENGPMWLGGYRVPENAKIADGYLRIYTNKGSRPLNPKAPKTTRSLNIVPSNWESAHLWSDKDFTDGYFEARIRYAKSPSTDQAFWLTESGGTTAEIDINEGMYTGSGSDTVSHTFHAKQGPQALCKTFSSGAKSTGKDLSGAFHVYGLKRSADALIWYIDGVESYRVSNTPFTKSAQCGGGTGKAMDFARNKPMHIHLSTAVSDAFGGVPASANGTNMIVDYVRYFTPN
jgi:beta-glucanase (GH16 family)